MTINYKYQVDLYNTYVGDISVENFIAPFNGDIEAAVDNLIKEKWWETAHVWTSPDDLRESLISYCQRTYNFDIQYDAAMNPDTPPNVLAELAMNENESIRWQVASNSNTPVSVLTSLLNDKRNILKALAKNPNTPMNILIKLSNIKNTNNPI